MLSFKRFFFLVGVGRFLRLGRPIRKLSILFGLHFLDLHKLACWY